MEVVARSHVVPETQRRMEKLQVEGRSGCLIFRGNGTQEWSAIWSTLRLMAL